MQLFFDGCARSGPFLFFPIVLRDEYSLTFSFFFFFFVSKKGIGQPSIFWISQRFLISLFFTIILYTLTTGLSKKTKLRISISRLCLGHAPHPHHAVCLVNKETGTEEGTRIRPMSRGQNVAAPAFRSRPV